MAFLVPVSLGESSLLSEFPASPIIRPLKGDRESDVNMSGPVRPVGEGISRRGRKDLCCCLWFAIIRLQKLRPANLFSCVAEHSLTTQKARIMTAQQARPCETTWRRLYEAAIAFRETACWNWMSDSDIFGVKDPTTGETGYCCVLGAGGEVLGMAVYPGTPGLEGYLKLLSSETGPRDPDFLFIHRCLTADFNDRDELDKADRDVIRSLGLKFRGRNAWPQFRSYLPGYFPWYLTEAEARFLALALEQGLYVCLRFRDNPSLLSSGRGGAYLVRTAGEKEGQLVWEDEWLEPEPFQKERLSFEPLDEARLARIKETLKPHDQIWEGDFFHLNNPVKEEGRPFYPRLFVWADVGSGLLLSQDMKHPDDPITMLRESLISAAEKNGFLPSEIRVRRQEAYELISPLAASLKLRLIKARALPSIDQFRCMLSDYFDSMS